MCVYKRLGPSAFASISQALVLDDIVSCRHHQHHDILGMNKIIGRNMWSETSEYERLKSLEREDDDLEESSELIHRSTVRLPRKMLMTLLACNMLLFIASVYILWAGTLGRCAPSEWECAKTVSPWCEYMFAARASSLHLLLTRGAAPLWEAVEFWEGNFDNDFAHPSKYRGPPTLELQQTWNDLWGGEHNSMCAPEKRIYGHH
ncbi:hypothetical protein J3458_020816 [Metarhizium acridum]|uniref:uncharacterized protein n=1 Tax=Metarhizium acridum TaxID=92637 RepID=UPI001C6C6706|nr:hypothetical protein J3458_020816 [Metarhizium acridum]